MLVTYYGVAKYLGEVWLCDNFVVASSFVDRVQKQKTGLGILLT